MIVGIKREGGAPCLTVLDDGGHAMGFLRDRADLERFTDDLFLAAEALWPSPEPAPEPEPAKDARRSAAAAKSWSPERRAAQAERLASMRAEGKMLGRAARTNA